MWLYRYATTHEDRSDRERDQRKLPFVEEEHCRHGQHGENVLEEEDQPVAEEEANTLQVDGRARHQLAGLMPVVEAEREPDEMGVEPLAHVHLDRECLLPGDEPAPRHEGGAQHAEAPRSSRRTSTALPASCGAIALSITRFVTPTSAICAPLRGDSEDDRDDE